MSIKEIIAHTPSPATRESLASDLSRLGVHSGMTLLVHCSLRSLGWVIGGPVSVVQALMDVVGSGGTIVMPTHTADYSDPASWQNPPVPISTWPLIRKHMPAFDPLITPAHSMGAVAEVFRTVSGTLRSNHPTASFAAWGKNAGIVTSDHSLSFGLGNQSPLARIYDLDGSVLLLGVGYDRNTSFHLAEYRMSNKKQIDCGSPIIENDQRVWNVYKDIVLNDEPFSDLGTRFETDSKVNCGKVALATCRVFKERDAVDYALMWMKQKVNSGLTNNHFS